jgi:putative membrane-bound dehydrogenase-like protein
MVLGIQKDAEAAAAPARIALRGRPECLWRMRKDTRIVAGKPLLYAWRMQLRGHSQRWNSETRQMRIKHLAIAACLLTLMLPVVAAQTNRGRPAPPATPAFRLPPGFTIERVAGPPLVDRPIVADFDDEGRLYVADSSGSNERVEKQLADRPHRIVRLEDKNGDGRFDTSVVFADRMMLPEGTMWLDGSLYVAAPPSIWKLTDTDGDGVADRREEWFKGETLTGCANDLHGPYLGPDGWIYWTKGAFAQQTHARASGSPLVTRAAHIFRRRPAAETLEVVMTGGMDNPVDVAFTPAGERILTATFLEHPQAGKRDALVHAVYGGVYGKPHNVLDGHKRTGDLMPVMRQLGPAVPAGLTRYASAAFGAGYRDSFFAAMFNLRKVTRHVLTPSGSTFTTRDEDFVVSDDRDFHPTDVVEDADGSLLVVDTGPWYKLCCPTSQLAKPVVLGAIYRIRRTGAATPRDPRGLALDWQSMSIDRLVARLDDPRPVVRNKAVQQLGRAGSAATPAIEGVLRRSASAEARRNAVWALARVDGPAARAANRIALTDRDESVRHAAIHAAGLWRDGGSLDLLASSVASGSPAIARAAAEALGRLGDARAVRPIVAAAGASGGDRVLEHSLTYALIEVRNPEATAVASHEIIAPRARRAALIALDQMEGAHLTPDAVLPLVDHADPILRDTAWWIAARHPEWGNALADHFRRALAESGGANDGAAQREALEQRLGQFAANPAVQDVLADAAAGSASPLAQRSALAAMGLAASSGTTPASGTRLKELPASWARAIARMLPSADSDAARQGLRIARLLPVASIAADELQRACLRVAHDENRSVDVRLEALNAVPAGSAVPAPSFELLRVSLLPASPSSARLAAAAAVERAKLDRSQALGLLPMIETVGPLELPRLLQAFASGAGSDEADGRALIASLERAAARASLRPDVLRPRLAAYPESVKRAAEALLASIHADGARQAQQLDALLAAVRDGDAARGQIVFNGSKAACISCHTIGYVGGTLGPDLTRIGQVRSERDLLEAVVFPNVSFARGYESAVVQTKSGVLHSGVLRVDGPDEIVLSAPAGPGSIDTRIPRNDVADVQPGVISLMPPGFAEVLTRAELADLLAFLRAAK